ncbi:hypothetical protein JCM11641_000171 [Rhodosporidiobolus odoratus]
MKCRVLEIRWHDRMPVFSTDFHTAPPTAHKKVHHPYAAASGAGGVDSALEDQVKRKQLEKAKEERDKVWRLATCGQDNNVRLWLVHPRPPPSAHPAPAKAGSASSSSAAPAAPTSEPKVEYLATLAKHTGVVNCVRFAPHGEMLASAGDDGVIILWVPGESNKTIGETEEDRAYEKESWRVKSMIRSFSGQEIYDISWSPDGEKIIAGSVDHSFTIYSIATGTPLHRSMDHSNYVQGVAWDPLDEYVATQSSDRSMHVYSCKPSPTGLSVHAVGKSSRMEVQRRPTISTRPSSRSRSDSTKKPASGSKDAPPMTSPSEASPSTLQAPSAPSEFAMPSRPPMHQRSLSRASDSDRSEASSTAPSSIFSVPPAAAPRPDEVTTAMDPPANIPQHPRASSHSRRTSTSYSGSAPSKSPGLAPVSSRPLRSPSPAPLPAVMVPLSPKLNPVASTSSGIPSINETVRTDSIRLYGDANTAHFFRRLAWSPDGGLLLTPAGLYADPYAAVQAQPPTATSSTSSAPAPVPTTAAGSGKKPAAPKSKKPEDKEGGKKEQEKEKTEPKPTVYIYSRSNVSRPPIAHLPGHRATSIAIRFCPVLWELRELNGEGDGEEAGEGEEPAVNVQLSMEGIETPLNGAKEQIKAKGKAVDGTAEEGLEGETKSKPRSLFDLPYRMVYAVATIDSVYLYDTQQAGPIAMFGSLHYKAFTDLTWSADGQTLVMSSEDGYCSIVAFEPGELGTPYSIQPSRDHVPHLHELHDPHAHNLHAHSASSPTKPSPLPAPAPVPASAAAGALPALFAKAADAAASSPVKPPHSASTTDGASVPASGEKRDGEGEGGEAPPLKKQKKRVAPTLVGPLA